MAVEMYEVFGSRETDGATTGSEIVLSYILTGSDDEAELRDALINEAVSGYNYDGTLFVMTRYSLAQEGVMLWRGSITYSHPDSPQNRPPQETNSSTVSFDTTGGTFKITEALIQRGYAPTGQSVPAIGNTIGVTDDKVEGVEITIPQLNFQETHYKPASIYINPYIKLVSSITGTVNDRPFRNFAAQELLFLGAQGQLRTQGDWEITYSFTAQSNITQPWQIGNITVTAKFGHEYLWVMYEKQEDDEDFVIPVPQAVFVSTVYNTSNFAGVLGI